MRANQWLLAAALTAGMTGAASAAPFQNGDFESGIDPLVFQGLPTGNTANITGWEVLPNGATYVGSLWADADGDPTGRSVELAATGAGGIKQTFDVVDGLRYVVTFFYSADPAVSALRLFEATVNSGANDALFSSGFPSLPSNVHNASQMIWIPASFSFVADGTAATIAFKSLTAGGFAIAVDNVSVVQVPLPMALPLFGAGLAALGLVSRRRKKGEAA